MDVNEEWEDFVNLKKKKIFLGGGLGRGRGVGLGVGLRGVRLDVNEELKFL